MTDYERLREAFEVVSFAWRRADAMRHPAEVLLPSGVALCWGKLRGAWSLFVRSSGGDTEINGAPRHLRVEAVAHIEALEEAVHAARTTFEQRLGSAVETLEDYAEGLVE